MLLKSSLEDNVLTALCWNDHLASALVVQVRPEHFGTRDYQKIATKAIDHILRYSQPPRAHIRDLLESELRRSDDSSRLLRSTIDSMESLAPEIQPDYVLSELSRFIEVQNMKNALMAATEALDSDDPVAAREALFAMPDAVNFSTGTWFHKPEESLRFMDVVDEDFFSIGVGELDRRGVYPTRGTVTMLIAPPKRGKSWFLQGCGKAAVMNSHSVLHVTLENSERLTSQRYVQNFYGLARPMRGRDVDPLYLPNFRREDGVCTEINFDELPVIPRLLEPAIRGELTSNLRKLSRRGRLLIKEFPSGTLTIGQLNAFMDSLARMENFVPDMLIVDYPKLMNLDMKQFRLSLSQTIVHIRGMCVARNMAGVIVGQSNSTGATARTLHSTNIAEDYSAIGTCDNILTYSQTAEEKKLNLARLTVAGSRESEDGYTVLLKQAYAIGQFCLDSTFHSVETESEVERLSVNTGGEQPVPDINE